MTTFGELYVGNLGTDFQFLCQTTNSIRTSNTATDLSTASSMTIVLTDPNGTATSYPAAILNSPGTDGLCHFITSITTSIWTISGFWTARCVVLFNDGSKASTQDIPFEVLP